MQVKFYLVNSDKKKILEFTERGGVRLFNSFISLSIFRCLSHAGLVTNTFQALKECMIILQLRYPVFSIDWGTLEGWIETHAQHLNLKELMNKSISIAKCPINEIWDSYTPRYYGPKGATIMLQKLLVLLGDEIQQIATEQQRIATNKAITSIVQFVQAVLVPELGGRLIIEDLTIGDREARSMLKLLAMIGVHVHGDDDEV